MAPSGLCSTIGVTVVAVVAWASVADAAKRESWRATKDRPPVTKQPPDWRMFAHNSIWNLPVTARNQLDPSSGRRVAALANLIDSRKKLSPALGGGYPYIAADTYSTPIYRVPAKAKPVTVKLPRRLNGLSLHRVAEGGVPIPDGAAPAVGTDGHLTVYQPSSDTLWEFWRARREGGVWHAEWGGAMRNVSRNPGYYDDSAWPRLRAPEGWNWGSTASSLPVAAGTVTRAELRAGRIDHALAMSIPSACQSVFTWPAQRTDGSSPALEDCLPMGAHLRLSPTVNVDALGLHPVARHLAKAAQTHGIVVRDSTRVSATLYLESSPPTGPSPYTGPGGLYGGVPPWQILEGFPWRSLELLPMRLCPTAPCRQGR